ncbi:RluA family pseudouridine synthase [Luxibacter massiliensis]|uniref:RluA family pseudouridine synthase n=1 Tax=Luxibacter massiliensis TaxID=2219695 RepID=UPI000F05844A|nr:RluA family pseudouridine synthase [Luxibacter massiliensis]
MERILEYHIKETEQNLRIEQYLKRKGYSRQNLTDLKKMPQSILVNKKEYHLKQTLKTNDLLRIHIKETDSSKHIVPTYLPLDILYEDEDIIIINKPSGLPIHPSMNNYTYSLANGLAWYFQRQNKAFIFRCTNRLDRDTSGLTVIAKHMLSSNILSSMTAKREMHREYLAVVRGHPTPPSGTICAPLSRKPGSIIERIVDFENGESAVTHYQTVKEKNGHSLLSLHLETGRTHQIRIHLKYLGFPLVGDYLYNPDMEYITRQALHCHCLAFNHPITGKKLSFSIPMPNDMAKILQ